MARKPKKRKSLSTPPHRQKTLTDWLLIGFLVFVGILLAGTLAFGIYLAKGGTATSFQNLFKPGENPFSFPK